MSLSVQNAVTMQQQSNIVHQVTTTQGVNLLYTVGTAATAMATDETLQSDTSENLVKIRTYAVPLYMVPKIIIFNILPLYIVSLRKS